MLGQDSSSGEADDGQGREWDADDPRRQNDQFAPPTVPCECFCLHCRRSFMSDRIWFQKINGGGSLDGFWMCPTPNCGGAGFTFDIFPTDPTHPANNGWFNDQDESDPGDRTWEEDDEEFEEFIEVSESQDEYDPDEPQYKALDQWSDEHDIEGDEWKFGLATGEPGESAVPPWVAEEEKKYDEPDQRPRELDWTDRQKPDRDRPDGGVGFNEDDIPY
jgi:hypothetical protein